MTKTAFLKSLAAGDILIPRDPSVVGSGLARDGLARLRVGKSGKKTVYIYSITAAGRKEVEDGT